MAVITCKNCGAPLQPGSENVCVCSFCGASNTVENNEDELSQITNGLIIASLLHLEREEWDEAITECERCLEYDENCATAYLCRFMANNHVRKMSESATLPLDWQEDPDYQKARQLASPELLAVLKRDEERAADYEKEQDYQYGCKWMKEGNNTVAIHHFKRASGYRDADQLAELCEKKQKQWLADHHKELSYGNGMDFMRDGDYDLAAYMFQEASGYRDADRLARKCEKKANGKSWLKRLFGQK